MPARTTPAAPRGLERVSRPSSLEPARARDGGGLLGDRPKLRDQRQAGATECHRAASAGERTRGPAPAQLPHSTVDTALCSPLAALPSPLPIRARPLGSSSRPRRDRAPCSALPPPEGEGRCGQVHRHEGRRLRQGALWSQPRERRSRHRRGSSRGRGKAGVAARLPDRALRRRRGHPRLLGRRLAANAGPRLAEGRQLC